MQNQIKCAEGGIPGQHLYLEVTRSQERKGQEHRKKAETRGTKSRRLEGRHWGREHGARRRGLVRPSSGQPGKGARPVRGVWGGELGRTRVAQRGGRSRRKFRFQ